MISDKEKYLMALKKNNGRIDEISIGLNIGFSDEKTTQIIAELVNEGKIEFQSFGLCSYRVL
ncbi:MULTISPECIES: DUF7343 domain-containing protein [Chitinophaga]|uniref:DUF7343 domain-containing protein n=1 Tax=Chitinophaga TaxID=79328 RepID=UPI0009D0EDA1|nr:MULTISPECIES: hypothetical protein [Chitinophaga]OMP74961.1 hypothetical protein BW716_32575 [[Flexibacter] sp. ATCC 35208]